MRTKPLLLTLAVIAILGLSVAACGDDDDDDGGGATSTATRTSAGGSPAGDEQDLTITASDFEFDRATITATEGQAINITFVNDGSAKHSFTVGDEDVAEAEGGAEAEGTFTASADTTEFHCKYHSQMKGTITVN